MFIHSFNKHLVSATILGAVATTLNKTNKAPCPRSLQLAYSPDKLYVSNYRAVLLISSAGYLGCESPSKFLLMGTQH